MAVEGHLLFHRGHSWTGCPKNNMVIINIFYWRFDPSSRAGITSMKIKLPTDTLSGICALDRLDWKCHLGSGFNPVFLRFCGFPVLLFFGGSKFSKAVTRGSVHAFAIPRKRHCYILAENIPWWTFPYCP